MAVIKFAYEVPLEQTMDFDAIYPDGLQFTLEEKTLILDTPGAIVVWMLVDGALAGEAYGVPVVEYDEPIEGIDELAYEEKRNAIYCYSNTILPAFQRRGLGDILKAHWLGLVASKGFKAVYGHAAGSEPGPQCQVWRCLSRRLCRLVRYWRDLRNAPACP